jgi:hypothetical protein
MIGDQADLLRRLKSVIPPWFGTNTPVLDALMSGPSNAFSGIYSLIQYAILQARLKSATDGWLDLIAMDFFARGFQRRNNEPDAAYQARIIAEILRPRVTRAAVSKAVADLTGIAPLIFEPARIADTGALGVLAPPTFALGGTWLPDTGLTVDSTITVDSTVVTTDAGPTSFAGVGAWGSLNYPAQFFITAYRPPGAGIPKVAAYTSATSPTGGGGYGVGSLEYVNLTNIMGQVTDAEIYATIARTIAAGTTAWTQITAFSGLTPANLIGWLPVSPDQVDMPIQDISSTIAFVEAAPF